MSTFWVEPYLLEQGDMIVAIARAYNDEGWSLFSDENTVGAEIQVVPHSPTESPILVSQAETSITIEMPTVSGGNTGGAAILSYNL